jgi:hypothetical protein
MPVQACGPVQLPRRPGDQQSVFPVIAERGRVAALRNFPEAADVKCVKVNEVISPKVDRASGL